MSFCKLYFTLCEHFEYFFKNYLHISKKKCTFAPYFVYLGANYNHLLANTNTIYLLKQTRFYC